jgi:hypothetical protein
MPDFKAAWIQKAQIDYFAPFISLWLACNSWYRSHYSDLSNNPEREAMDREFINKIKTDFTGRNHLFKEFVKIIKSENNKKTLGFKTNLEMLYFTLNRAELKPDKLIYNCSFEKMLIDFSQKENQEAYINILATPKINQNGTVHSDEIDYVIKLDTKYIINDTEKVFAGLFELIYQIRNMVIHGNVKPEKDEHEVVKYCYLILSDLMEI